MLILSVFIPMNVKNANIFAQKIKPITIMLHSVKINRLFFGLFILLPVLFTSCRKMEFDKIASGAWNPNLAVPLAHSSFSVYDILAYKNDSELVVIDPSNGAIALTYRGEIASFNAQDLVKINTQNIQHTISLSEMGMVSAPSYTGSVSSSNTKTLTASTDNGVEIHTMNVFNGILEFHVSTELKHDIAITITFPEIKKNGIPISRTVQLNYNGSLPQSITQQINLKDSDINFTKGNTTVNTIEAVVSGTVTGTGNEVVGNESINIDFHLSGIEFENVTGYFGQQNLGLTADTILLRLFQNAISGYFEFTNPSVTFFIDNDLGMPSQLNFSDLKTINTATGQEYPLIGFPSTVSVDAPTSLGQTATTSLSINTSNTQNLNTIVSPTPKYFYLNASATANPSGNTGVLNTVERNDRLSVRTELMLPLEGFAHGFQVIDTVNFSLTQDVSNIESVMFRLWVNNGFPTQFVTNIIFTDADYSPLFNVFSSPNDVISSALVDGNGKVNQKTEKITDIVLTPEQISKLGNAKHIIINGVAGTINGTSGQIVKFFESYTLDMKLSTQIQGKFGL
jgi:hypothetical protein